MKRINVTLDEQTLGRLERLSRQLGLTRSSAIRVAVAEKIEREEPRRQPAGAQEEKRE